MSNVKIVTDSTADIPAELAQKLGIEVVPLKVHFGNQAYLDGVDISASQFYKKLEQASELPTTSQPSPADFEEVYTRLQDQSEEKVEIISIHLSAALSGTFQSASLAKDMVENSVSVEVLDSKKASYATGMIVVAVAEAAQQGKSAEECSRLARDFIEHAEVYFLVDSLKYLEKGGRIGKASALLGSLLNIKPILSLDDEGEIYPADKVRGHKKALARISQFLHDYAGEEEVRLAICHAAVPEQAEKVLKQFKNEYRVQESVLTEIGPVVGTHVGPGTMGIIMVKTMF